MRKKLELRQKIVSNKEICSAMRKMLPQWKKDFRNELFHFCFLIRNS